MEHDAVVRGLVAWGERSADVRALVLTSSRAIPGADVDAYSDYDVVVACDVVAMTQDVTWLGEFGEVLVTYWDPVSRSSASGGLSSACIAHYVDGGKIDFGLVSPEAFAERVATPAADSELDAGHVVLLDKDGVTTAIPAPTYRAYIPQPPDEDEYRHVLSNFLVGVPYIAKCLMRDELIPAKWVLDYDMRFGSLVPMLWWRVECDHGWSLKAPLIGRRLRTHLSDSEWREVADTYADADPESNWEAMFRMIDLFERLSREVATLLGFTHPGKQFERVRDHAVRMRAGWTTSRESTVNPGVRGRPD